LPKQIPILLAVVGLSTFCGNSIAQPHFVEWDIEAVVFRITDPQNLFPEVRLGDPVRGSIRYNVNNVPALDHPELGTFYDTSTIEAQINQLTPVNLPIVPGDYDGDADVDAQDYTVWSITECPIRQFRKTCQYNDGFMSYDLWVNVQSTQGGDAAGVLTAIG
jgi:hypothetical protein